MKRITGTWFEFHHHSEEEGLYWNRTCAGFRAEDWDEKIKDIANAGMKYVVLQSVACDYKAYSKTSIYPNAGYECEDPLRAVLCAADKYGLKFFIGAGFYGDWSNIDNCLTDKWLMRLRHLAMEELAENYGHHKSFYGWYWSDESEINGHFDDVFTAYISSCGEVARKLKPEAKILIAPYGTRIVTPDDRYVRQLERLDVDMIAYQDEVGVRKTNADHTAAFFEGLRKAHDKAGRSALWADVEVFDFEGEVYESALIPAPFARVAKQLEAVSPYVDEILIYQYLGLMNKPGTSAFAGHPESTKLYVDYMNRLNNG